jgi:glutathione peroxidase
VNGDDAHPLFKYLKGATDGYELNWNFNKFLVVDGVPVKRYFVDVSPSDIEDDLLSYLNAEL